MDGGIEFEFPLIPTEEELRQMSKDVTREKLTVLDGNPVNIQDFLFKKGWEMIDLTIVSNEDGGDAQEIGGVALEEFKPGDFAINAEGILLKDTDAQVIFQGNYNIMADIVGSHDPIPIGSSDEGKCFLIITESND